MAPLPKTVLKRMQDWLKENFTEVWEEEVCPPSSPDCNPFDYFVWGCWAGCVYSSKSIERFEFAFRKLLGEIEAEFVRNLKCLIDFEVRT